MDQLPRAAAPASPAGDPDTSPKLWQSIRVSLFVAGLIAVLMLAWAISAKLMTYDEYYTFFVTQPQWRLGLALTEHWLPDNHPPLHYFLVYLVRQIASDVPLLRAITLVGLALALAAIVVIVSEHKKLKVATALFLAAVPSNPHLFNALVILRSYGLQIAADCVVLVGLAAYLLDRELSRRSRWVLGTAIVIGLNLHVQNSAGLAALIAVVAMIAARRGDRRFAVWLTAVSALGAAILALTTVFQIEYWQHNAAGLPEYGWRKFKLPLLTALAVLAPVPLHTVLAASRGRTIWLKRKFDPLLPVVAAYLGVGVGLLVMYLVFLPRLLEMYYTVLSQLMALYALCLLTMAALERLSLRRAKWICWAMVAIGAATQAYHADTARKPLAAEWPGLAWLSAQKARCADTAIHVVAVEPHLYHRISGPDAAGMLPGFLRYVADEEAIAIEPAGSRRTSAECPTIFWLNDWLDPDLSSADKERAVTRSLRAQGFPVQTVDMAVPEGESVAIAKNAKDEELADEASSRPRPAT